jgi:hypothetical protein
LTVEGLKSLSGMFWSVVFKITLSDATQLCDILFIHPSLVVGLISKDSGPLHHLWEYSSLGLERNRLSQEKFGCSWPTYFRELLSIWYSSDPRAWQTEKPSFHFQSGDQKILLGLLLKIA